MKETTMKTTLTTLVAVASLAFAGAAAAQDKFPSRPVTLTVGFAPGGGTDTAGRIVAKKLSENIGQSVVVENKAGAGGNIAAQHAASSAPDGYLIHLSSVGPLTVAPAMSKALPYDPKKDLAPLTLGMRFSNVLVIHPTVPAKTLAEFVALAKKEPGKLNYASSGIGGAAHLAGELFKQMAGIDMVHVPYKGGGPAMADMLGGRVSMYPAVPSTSKPHIDGGKIVAIGTTGAKRTAIMPNVPTVAEQGYPGFEATNWYAFVISSKVPKDIQQFWTRELVKALKDPEVIAALDKQGLEPEPGTPEELAKLIDIETEKWSKVVREAKITAE
jgi:tripartite-type tricarboxylate transporter receptor subunit TctC